MNRLGWFLGRSIAVYMLAMLVACGGGGSSESAEIVPTPPQPNPVMVVICRTQGGDISADASGGSDASPQLQRCLDSAILEDGVWMFPRGKYLLGQALDIRRNDLTIAATGVTWIASRDIRGTGVPHTMVYARGLRGVRIIGLTLDGNIAQRQGASYCDGTVNAYAGGNIHFESVEHVTLEHFTSMNAVCGSGMHVIGKHVRITKSTFAHNGMHKLNHWSDGITLLVCDDCVLSDNEFIDNSDIGLVFGGGLRTVIEGNRFVQTKKIFAALAMDNFNNSTPGNFQGSMLVRNSIECGDNLCDFGINIGPHAWYPSSNIRNGTVTENTIHGAKIGILAQGAGTANEPVHVYANSIIEYPATQTEQEFSCGTRPVAPRVYGRDSFIDTHGESGNYFVSDHANCP